ncbi:MAG: collagen binding domain-containing protein [Blautia sp.]
MWYKKWMKRVLVCSLFFILAAGIISLNVWASETEEMPAADQWEDDPGGEQILPGIYSKIESSRQRSAVTSQIEVKWNESLAVFDSSLIRLDDPFNSSIKYVNSTDKENPDMKGKQRVIYCIQYGKNGPLGQVSWTGGGKVSPGISYLMYWGCRYLGRESVLPAYRTGYGWKYDYMATQYAVHIVNQEYSFDTLCEHLSGSKKDTFCAVIKKMTEDAGNASNLAPFQEGWKTFTYTLSDSSVEWKAETYQGEEGYTTKWITQNLSDGQTVCSEYIQEKWGTADKGAVIVWKDEGDASDFRIWIPKKEYLKLQVTGETVTASVGGSHSLCLAGWTYRADDNPDQYQMVTLLEGGGGTAEHEATVTAPVPKKNINCYVELQKEDKETGKAEPQGACSFEGAVYEVRNAEGMVVDKMKTDRNGKAVSAGIAPGTYTVKEVEAPNGYELDPQTYTIVFENTDADQTQYISHLCSREPPQKGSVKLRKLSAHSHNGLAGAVFELYNGKNERVGSYTSDETGCILVENLVCDSYFFLEAKAPEGYEKTEKSIPFIMEPEQMGNVLEIQAENKPKEVSVELIKEIDARDINFANGVPMFLFEVKGKDIEGNYRVYHRIISFPPEYVDTAGETDGKIRGKAVFDHLYPGIYQAEEMKVMRYSLTDIIEISGGVKNNHSVEFDLIQNEKGSAVFVNEKEEWGDWSHTALCENRIPGKEGV